MKPDSKEPFFSSLLLALLMPADTASWQRVPGWLSRLSQRGVATCDDPAKESEFVMIPAIVPRGVPPPGGERESLAHLQRSSVKSPPVTSGSTSLWWSTATTSRKRTRRRRVKRGLFRESLLASAFHLSLSLSWPVANQRCE